MGPEARNQNQGLRVVRLGLEMRQKKQDLAARLAYPIAIAWRRRAVCWQGYHACSEPLRGLRLPRLMIGLLASLGAGPSSQSPSCSCTLCCPRLHAVCRFESERHWFHTHTPTHTDNLWRGLTLFVVPLCSLSFPPSAPLLLATSASTGQTSARAMRGKHAWSSFLFASCLPHASHERLCPMSSAPMPSLVRI